MLLIFARHLCFAAKTLYVVLGRACNSAPVPDNYTREAAALGALAASTLAFAQVWCEVVGPIYGIVVG